MCRRAEESAAPAPGYLRWLARLARAYTLHSPVRLGKHAILAGRGPFGVFSRRRLEATVPTLVGTRSHIRFPDMIQRGIYFCGVWEPAITSFVRQTLRTGDTLVDVGANIGYYSCLAAKLVAPSGHVHAIEASPAICRLLEANLRLNQAANVTTHNVAAMDRTTRVPVYLGPESSLGTSTVFAGRAARRRPSFEAEVPAEPLAAIVGAADLFRARLVKVDVEGAEWPVYRGIENELARFGDDTEWIIEVTPEAVREQGGTVTAMREGFARAGYRSYRLENRYDIDWYVREARALLRRSRDALVLAAPADLEAEEQLDLLFTRRVYPHAG